MDNIKLAELLFKDTNLTIDECLASYPKRILPVGAEVTRIAPSPTGYLHIGHVYGAFIDKLIAYHSNGVYFMRLEDTDSKREVEHSADIAFDMLSLFGLKPDEGFMGSNHDEVGEFAPYVQSKRTEIYKCFAKYFVSIGRAYPCFCGSCGGKDEILQRRQEQLEANSDIEEKDKCRDLTFDEIEKNILAGKPFAIRLKSLGDPNKTFKVKDKIKGEREVRQNCKDIIILKSNGVPPYSLAHVVDDTLMGTTTVVRGEEWYPSLASHIELFEAFGLRPPKYAHTPVICKLDEDGNKRKLSKRKDPEADARYFVEKGYPISSVMEYLLNLINSDFEDWRRQNPLKDYYEFPFKVSKIGSNNPMFDLIKLDDCSKKVISHMPSEVIYQNLLNWAQRYNEKFYNKIVGMKDFCISLFDIDRVNTNNPRKDISKWSDIESLYFYMFNDICNLEIKNFDFDSKINKEDIKKILIDYLTIYDENDEKQEWFEKIKILSDKNGFCSNIKEYKQNPQNYKGSVADVSGIIRVAITTKQNSPDLYMLMKLLGKTNVGNRIKNIINKI